MRNTGQLFKNLRALSNMSRYSKHNRIILGLMLSKLPVYNQTLTPALREVNVQAGHFRLNSIWAEHGLIFSELTGQKPKIQFFVHGKRNRHTVLLQSSIRDYSFIDKLVNVVLPLIEDLGPYWSKKSSLKFPLYTWRLRKYFFSEEYNPFLTDRLMKKDVFLPLFLNIGLTSNSNYYNQNYLRMLRVPMNLYKYIRPAD